MENTRITARVEGIDEFNGLKIRIIDTDEQAYIPINEISRRDIRNPQYLLGNLICVVPLESTKGELPVYSAKVVEEAEYEKIRSAFESGERNTYTATFKSIDQSGKLALYELAKGVVGAIHVKNFCLNRLENYQDWLLPSTLPVSIMEMNGDKINLSAVASFGAFGENVEALGIEVNAQVEGYTTGRLPDNSGTVVMLAPNIYTVVKWAPIGKQVIVQVKGIDYNLNKLKANYVAECGDQRMDISRFIIHPTEAFVDSKAFVEANKVKKAAKVQIEQVDDDLEDEPVAPSFDINSTVSPLRLFDNETIVFEDSLPHAALGKGISTGRLTQKHAELAEAVDTLKFTTIYHLERYLYLTSKGKVTYSKKTIEKMLETLCIYHVLIRFRYSSDITDENKKSMYYVYTRGTNFKPFVGSYHSFMYKVPIDGESSSFSKGRLAVNQLLLALMRRYTDLELHDGSYQFNPGDHDKTRLFSCYRIYTQELGACVLESCRRDYDDQLLAKLLRYKTRLLDTKEECSVLITLEDAKHVEAFAEKVDELELNYKVYLTHDLNCFEDESIFTKVILPKSTLVDGGKGNLWTKLFGITGLLSGMFH